MKAYRVYTGIFFYVSGSSVIEAMETLCAFAREEGVEIWEGETSISFKELTRFETCNTKIYDDGTGAHVLIADDLKRQTKPQVFACSEWP